MIINKKELRFGAYLEYLSLLLKKIMLQWKSIMILMIIDMDFLLYIIFSDSLLKIGDISFNENYAKTDNNFLNIYLKEIWNILIVDHIWKKKLLRICWKLY